MKRLITIIGIAFFSGCKTFTEDKIKAFIPGTYVTDYQQEYSKGHDTLVFTCVSDEGNSYLITRKTTYKRILDGKEGPPESRKNEMAGIYNGQDKVIYETRYRRTFSFSPERNIVLSGTQVYKKID